MIFMGWWETKDGRTNKGLVKAEYADDAIMKLTSCLQEGCIVKNVIYFCDEENDCMITPQMLCVNFPNTSQYTLFG